MPLAWHSYTVSAMPIYEYRRPDGSTFEVMQKFSDDALTHDPETGVPVERVLSAPAIHFKGSGFHNTDYGTRKRNREMKDSAESGAAKTEAKATEKAEKADKKKADPKPSSDKKAA